MTRFKTSCLYLLFGILMYAFSTINRLLIILRCEEKLRFIFCQWSVAFYFIYVQTEFLILKGRCNDCMYSTAFRYMITQKYVVDLTLNWVTKQLHINFTYISDILMKLINYVKSHKCLVLTQSFKLQMSYIPHLIIQLKVENNHQSPFKIRNSVWTYKVKSN